MSPHPIKRIVDWIYVYGGHTTRTGAWLGFIWIVFFISTCLVLFVHWLPDAYADTIYSLSLHQHCTYYYNGPYRSEDYFCSAYEPDGKLVARWDSRGNTLIVRNRHGWVTH
jgi:hypothetical protein